ncbi:MAG: porin family protein [Roseobacter sp.]|jgi:opacity protein-like surface antigen|nr:porin family protein [Roseobacter sp.]
MTKANFGKISLAVAMGTGVCLGAVGTKADARDWSYAASIYLFTPQTDLSIGPVDSELSFSDALENLDFAFMGAFEASNGQWSFLLDYMRTDLGFSGETPGDVFAGVDTDLNTQVLSGYVGYRVYDRDGAEIDLTGGFRWFKTESTLAPFGGPVPVTPVSVSDDWADPLIGIRGRFDLVGPWLATASLDYGGSGDSSTYQALLTFGYEATDNWLLSFGYRYLQIENELNGEDFEFTQSGPIFGATYRF